MTPFDKFIIKLNRVMSAHTVCNKSRCHISTVVCLTPGSRVKRVLQMFWDDLISYSGRLSGRSARESHTNLYDGLHLELKGALCGFEGAIFFYMKWKIFIDSFNVCLNKHNLCLFFSHNLINKLNNFILVFLCSRPCHLSGFKQCSEDLFSLWEQHVHSVMDEINHSL